MLSRWELETGHGENCYAAEIGNRDKSRLFPLENWLVDIYQHVNGLGNIEDKGDLLPHFLGNVLRCDKPLEVHHMSNLHLAKGTNDFCCVACDLERF